MQMRLCLVTMLLGCSTACAGHAAFGDYQGGRNLEAS